MKYIDICNFYLFIFRKRGKEGERKGERYQCVIASHVLPTGGGTQACALDWDQIGHPLVCRPKLNQQSYSSQGHFWNMYF